jgi:hypothetical protein
VTEDEQKEDRAKREAKPKVAPVETYRHVLTLQLAKSTSGRFVVTSPEIDGLVVWGIDVGDALEQVPEAVAVLERAGCKQSLAILARANAPVTGKPSLRVAARGNAASGSKVPARDGRASAKRRFPDDPPGGDAA